MILQFTEHFNNENRPCYVDSDYIRVISTPNNAPPWGASVIHVQIGQQPVAFLVTEGPEQAMRMWSDARLIRGGGHGMAQGAVS